ncbi:MAG: hypothetical protein PVH87_17065 [Desulfobacteraceae bacterium]|jgi:hypothetical protein
MKLFLEMFLWTLEKAETVRFFHLQTDITESPRDPDAVMKDQMELLGMINGKGARYAHSTSWRYEDGRTLLTYLVWVHGHELENLPTRQLFIPSVTCPTSRGPLSPRPESICEAHVLVHGLRHLRYLALDQEDVVAAELLECRQTCIFLHSLEPALSGRFETQPTTVVEDVQVATL